MKLKWILRQLKKDLIGKDSHRGVTLTYAWLANQFGHFSLGFIPTLIIYNITNQFNNIRINALNAAIIVSIGWLVFELWNFLGPLLFKKIPTSKLLYLGNGNKYVFNPKWKNIAFDTFTDLLFFWLGAFSSSCLISFSNINILIVFILLLAIFYPSYYWFVTRMYQSYAKYPLQYRLSQWDKTIEEEDKKKVINFISQNGKGNHLFVFGSKKSGKTSLGIAIANELSIKHKKCFYTTAIKLYSMFYEANKRNDTTKAEWTWRSTDYLIIDDINPGYPIIEELVDPKKFLQFLDNYQNRNSQNRETIKNKNIIWILGHEDSRKNVSFLKSSWIPMLEELGVDANKIKCIVLE